MSLCVFPCKLCIEIKYLSFNFKLSFFTYTVLRKYFDRPQKKTESIFKYIECLRRNFRTIRIFRSLLKSQKRRNNVVNSRNLPPGSLFSRALCGKRKNPVVGHLALISNLIRGAWFLRRDFVRTRDRLIDKCKVSLH